MNHQEIRFQILFYLYNKHYGGELNKFQVVEAIIEETELKNLDKNTVYGDVVYLEQSALIRGEYVAGPGHPPWIMITSLGIDRVDAITNEVINETSAGNYDKQVQTDIETISNEPDPKNKINKVWDYVKANPAFFTSIIEKVLNFALGGSLPH